MRCPALSSRSTVSSRSPERSSRHAMSRRASAKGTAGARCTTTGPHPTATASRRSQPPERSRSGVPAHRVLLERGVEHDQCRAVRLDWPVQRHHEVLRLVDDHQPGRGQHRRQLAELSDRTRSIGAPVERSARQIADVGLIQVLHEDVHSRRHHPAARAKLRIRAVARGGLNALHQFLDVHRLSHSPSVRDHTDRPNTSNRAPAAGSTRPGSARPHRCGSPPSPAAE